MKSLKAILCLMVCFLIIANISEALESCIPKNELTPAIFWDDLNASKIVSCINKHAQNEIQVLNIDDKITDNIKRKAMFIKAWYSLLQKLDVLRSGQTNNLGILSKQVYLRAEDAWKSITTGSYGEGAAPQAYRSAWEIDFKGNLPPLKSQFDQSEIAPKIELMSILTQSCMDEGDTCPETTEYAVSLLKNIALALQISTKYGQPIIDGLAAKVQEINSDWDRFLFNSKPMYPWDLWLTSVLNRRTTAYDMELGLREAPNIQYFFLHPAPGFSYVGNAADGDELQPTIYIELFGVNKWQWKYFTGASFLVEYSDRADVDDFGVGALLVFQNKYSIGLMMHDEDFGITLGLDLANFYKEKLKPQIESIKTELPR